MIAVEMKSKWRAKSTQRMERAKIQIPNSKFKLWGGKNWSLGFGGFTPGHPDNVNRKNPLSFCGEPVIFAAL
jgi:hypothetical protein